MHKFQIDICNLLEFLKRYNNTISSFLARMLFKRYLNFMRAFLPDFNFMYSTSIYPKLMSDFNMMASNCSISQKLYYFIIIFSMISSFIRVNWNISPCDYVCVVELVITISAVFFSLQAHFLGDLVKLFARVIWCTRNMLAVKSHGAIQQQPVVPADKFSRWDKRMKINQRWKPTLFRLQAIELF